MYSPYFPDDTLQCFPGITKASGCGHGSGSVTVSATLRIELEGNGLLLSSSTQSASGRPAPTHGRASPGLRELRSVYHRRRRSNVRPPRASSDRVVGSGTPGNVCLAAGPCLHDHIVPFSNLTRLFSDVSAFSDHGQGEKLNRVLDSWPLSGKNTADQQDCSGSCRAFAWSNEANAAVEQDKLPWDATHRGIGLRQGSSFWGIWVGKMRILGRLFSERTHWRSDPIVHRRPYYVASLEAADDVVGFWRRGPRSGVRQ